MQTLKRYQDSSNSRVLAAKRQMRLEERFKKRMPKFKNGAVFLNDNDRVHIRIIVWKEHEKKKEKENKKIMQAKSHHNTPRISNPPIHIPDPSIN